MNTALRSALLRTLSIIAASVAGLSGCALVGETTTNLVASRTPAIAVFDGRVLHGRAVFTSAREATVQLQEADAAGLSCSGALRFGATHTGATSFQCSDGRSGAVPFESLSQLSGAGRGVVGNAAFAWTYGLPPEKAAGYLALPVERLQPPKTAAGG